MKVQASTGNRVFDQHRLLEFPLVAAVIGQLKPLNVQVQRLAGQQALVAGILVVVEDRVVCPSG